MFSEGNFNTPKTTTLKNLQVNCNKNLLTAFSTWEIGKVTRGQARIVVCVYVCVCVCVCVCACARVSRFLISDHFRPCRKASCRNAKSNFTVKLSFLDKYTVVSVSKVQTEFLFGCFGVISS
jgi:hypothetical protein